MTLLAPASRISTIDAFDAPDLSVPPAVALDRVRAATPAFKEWFRSTGTVDLFASRALVTLPYPRRYALWEACALPWPYVWMTNRVMVVRWTEGERTRTALIGPSDYELGENTPFLRTDVARMPLPDRVVLDRFFIRHGAVVDHLAGLGIAPEEVDTIVFDHLHTQDVRRLIGTTVPAPDLGHPDAPVPATFPNATLVVQRTELEHVRSVHPFQARFMQAATYAGIDESRVTVVDGDVLLGPGVAVLRSPGHTLGNVTIVVNTPRGIVCSSENGVAIDSWVPDRSRIPGVRRWAREQGMEVLLNFNTPEFASFQYNSMVREKLIADPVPGREDLPLVMPSSELVPHRLAPRIAPLHSTGDFTWAAS